MKAAGCVSRQLMRVTQADRVATLANPRAQVPCLNHAR